MQQMATDGNKIQNLCSFSAHQAERILACMQADALEKLCRRADIGNQVSSTVGDRNSAFAF